MKIVQIMPEFGLAGAEIMCENLTYKLRKLGHDVVIVSMYDYHSAITDRLENAGVDIRYLYKQPGIDFSMILKIKRILKDTGADVVHTHRYCAQYAIPAAMLAGVKHRVHTVHNVAQNENGKLARKLNKFFFKYCNLKPVALSGLIRDSIVEEYRIKSDTIPIVFNGIDLSRCLPKDSYQSHGNFKILHIGRFSEQKNHTGLIEAYGLFHRKYTDTELWLIGDGDKRSEIEEYVHRNELTECVKFWGLQSDVHQYLNNADIFTLPSNYEGIPMTLIEAMGTGLPIVATPVGGVPDMLTNDISALLVNNTPEDIANAFEQYYLSQDLRKKHGINAKEKSIAFSATTMALKYEEVYKL